MLKKLLSAIVGIAMAAGLSVSAFAAYDVSSRVSAYEAAIAAKSPPAGYPYVIVLSRTFDSVFYFIYSKNPVVAVGDSTICYAWDESKIITYPASTLAKIAYDNEKDARYSYISFTDSAHMFFGKYVLDCSTADFVGHQSFVSSYPHMDAYIYSLPDTTELKAVLAEAKAIEDVGYTAYTWSRLQTAIYEGDELLTRPTYTAPQVATATMNVRTGIGGLVVYAAPNPGNHRYLIDGFRLVDLLPAQDAIMQNFSAARNFGLFLFAVLIGITVVVRLLKRFLHAVGGGASNDANLR